MFSADIRAMARKPVGWKARMAAPNSSTACPAATLRRYKGGAMPYSGGDVAINTPPGGTAVVVGATFRVAGTTSPRIFVKPNGTFETEIPPSAVTFRLDGGASQPATALSADWSAWETNLRVPTPGPHTIVVAGWNLPGGYTAEDTVTVDAVATPLNLVEPAGAVSTVGFPVVVSASHPKWHHR
jgi:hypothetical protein